MGFLLVGHQRSLMPRLLDEAPAPSKVHIFLVQFRDPLQPSFPVVTVLASARSWEAGPGLPAGFLALTAVAFFWIWPPALMVGSGLASHLLLLLGGSSTFFRCPWEAASEVELDRDRGGQQTGQGEAEPWSAPGKAATTGEPEADALLISL